MTPRLPESAKFRHALDCAIQALTDACFAGCCFLVGGFKYNVQQFSATVNKASCSLLFLACIAIVIPTAAPVFYKTDVISDASINTISHSTAIILVLV